MKQYVLDEPAAPAAPPPVAAAGLPRQPWPWRALLVLAVVEPLALGGLYLALDADARPVERAQPLGPATIAAFSLPRSAEPAAAAAPAEAPARESRIAVERGKYVIDLRSTEVGPALAMLVEATKATVHGADVLSREPARLSRSAVVATPAEAWQTVFGDVANFAVSCTQKGCAVFVAPVAKGQNAAAMLPATVDANAEGESAELAAAALAANRLATTVSGPGAPQRPENSESEN